MSLMPKSVSFNEVWHSLRNTVEALLELRKVSREDWNQGFTEIYTLCVAYPESYAERLYMQTKYFLAHHVTDLLTTRVAPRVYNAEFIETFVDKDLLERYYDSWMKYREGVEIVDRLYKYLNTHHVKKKKVIDIEKFCVEPPDDMDEQLEISNLGLDIWRLYMIESLSRGLMNYILEGINADRYGLIDEHRKHIISESIYSIILVEHFRKDESLELYRDLVEVPVLKASDEHYYDIATKLVHRCTVSEYLDQAITLIGDEERRAVRFLDSSSWFRHFRLLQEHFVINRLDFIYSECETMVRQEIEKDLRNMYRLVKPLPKDMKCVLTQALQQHIKNQGLQKISNLVGDNKHVQFVENMIKVYQKFQIINEEVFDNDPLMVSALDKACSIAINHRPSASERCRSAEYMARYCDMLLKKSKNNETEVDEKLTDTVTIFRYLEDEDVYQRCYTQFLSNRLINDETLNMDAEEAMIGRLKQTCGFEFTCKWQRMFTDVSISSHLNNEFRNYLVDQNTHEGMNVSVKVLAAGAWPIGPPRNTRPFVVPQALEKIIQSYEAFYHGRFNGRKLTWLHHMCHGEMKLDYLDKPYIVTMQTYQMAIMLLFESNDSLTYNEIQQSLQLNDETFRKYLLSLLESNLLLADSESAPASPSPSPSLQPNTKIHLNFGYTNKRTKFKISWTRLKETPAEVKRNDAAIEEDRKFYLQASIVRILKSRKILKLNDLTQEVLSQAKVLMFTPSQALLKKCIDLLIDKQYIKHNPGTSDGDEFSYIA